MNDVTMIYRIVEINRAFIYLFKNFVSKIMNLSISSPQKSLITHNWKYFLVEILITILSYSKLDH